jgi:flavin reductase (DIM6/NTAB) family NADH-FMN oxidoreductase RutF
MQRATGFDATELRRVLGHLPTGVTVVTAFTDDGPTGMAVNSVTSVSLDPPLLLVCPARTSTTWPNVRASGRFCVNVMARHHEEACRRFALKDADRFAGVDWSERPGGPAFHDAVAWIDCELREEHDAGDHTIAVADVLGIDAAAARPPLVFFRGRYGGFER